MISASKDASPAHVAITTLPCRPQRMSAAIKLSEATIRRAARDASPPR
ncbi:hypothetical protein KCP71_13460 [Salmonella enterica subsp. enterica]|nr:hypothetical protein KCP71_13460 [Salmonella enterica subsp. enterica]